MKGMIESYTPANRVSWRVHTVRSAVGQAISTHGDTDDARGRRIRAARIGFKDDLLGIQDSVPIGVDQSGLAPETQHLLAIAETIEVRVGGLPPAVEIRAIPVAENGIRIAA